jgi:hypothetical protein
VLLDRENVFENLTKIYAQYPLDSEQFLFSSFWSEYAVQYVKGYRSLLQDDFDMQRMKDLYANGRIHTFYMDESKNCLTGKALEFIQATFLYSTAF